MEKIYIEQILRRLCEHKGIKIIEVNVCKDYIHMFASILSKLSTSQFMVYIMGYIKGKSL